MENETQEMGSKVTLSSGKIVLLRPSKISHQTLAARTIEGKTKDPLTYTIMLNEAMIRLLVHSVNGQAVHAKDLVNLDGVFTAREYKEINEVVAKLAGSDDPLEPTVEAVSMTSGGK